MADEIPEAAVQAAAEVLFERWRNGFAKGLNVDVFGMTSDAFADEARVALAAALPHLDETRVVLIKPGDALVIGGVELAEEHREHFTDLADALRKVGFPRVLFAGPDASIAVQPGADHA